MFPNNENEPHELYILATEYIIIFFGIIRRFM